MEIEIKTERLKLRPLRLQDLNDVHTYASDLENTRYMLFLPNDTLEETEAFLRSAQQEWQREQPEDYEFGIELDGHVIGAVSVYLTEDRTEGEMGWILNKRFWRKGYMLEAAMTVRNYAIQKLGVMRLVAHCDDRNEPSWRLMEKLSFRMEDANGSRTYAKTGEQAIERTYSLTVAD